MGGMRRWVTGAAVVGPLVALLAVTGLTAPAHANPAVGPATVESARAAALPPKLAGKAFTRIPTRKKLVALTFDAGGGAGGVTSILRTLKSEGITATFFLTGRWASTYPAKVRRIARAGHVLGNHTETHGKVPDMSDVRLTRELKSTDAAVTKAAGRGTQPWFRFPYGAHSARDIRRVNDRGYAAIQWTVDSAGWLGTSGGMSVAKVERRVMDAIEPGAIVLMHVGQHPTDGSTLDADTLPRLISDLRGRGYEFTTLEALLPAS